MGPFLLVGKYCKMHLELMVVLMSGQWCGTSPTCLQLVTPILHLELGAQQVLAHSTAHCCSLKHMNSCGKRRMSRRYKNKPSRAKHGWRQDRVHDMRVLDLSKSHADIVIRPEMVTLDDIAGEILGHRTRVV